MYKKPLMKKIVQLLSFWALSFTLAQAAVDQDELDRLLAAGATELALSLLQEDVPADAESWRVQQKQKLDIYRQQQNWRAMLDEVVRASAFELPPADLQWLQTQAAIAYLGQGDGVAARDVLMSLLWAKEENNTLFRQWRELVVRSYLVDGRYEDANTAALRYEQDYSDALQQTSWLLLKAQLMLFSGRSDDALALLSGAVEKNNPVLLLAQLKSGVPVPIEGLLAGVKAISRQPSADIAQPLYEALLKADERLASLSDKVLLLEHLLASAAVGDVDVKPTADALWQAYEALALQVANREQLLIGNFEPWVEVAGSLAGKDALEARALNAWLALHSEGDLARHAHERFGRSLDETYGSFELIAALYLAAGRFSGGETLPIAIRYRLLDNALTQGNEQIATAMMNSLPRPAGIKALVDWQLRRARVQVLAGTAEYGTKLLEQLTKSGYDFDAVQLAAYLQVFYDLQARNSDILAYKVANAVLPQLVDSPLQQQVLRWLAEQDQAQGRPARAARRYVQLADLSEAAVAQQALLEAAQALRRAGLVSDAEHLYQRALAGAENDAQRRFILQAVKRLHAQGSVSAPQ